MLAAPPLAPPAKVKPVRVVPAHCPTAGTRARLFREAPQLKTVGAIARVTWGETCRVETQLLAISTADRRRPAIPVVTDVRQIAQSPIIARVTVARGGVSSPREKQTASYPKQIRRAHPPEASDSDCIRPTRSGRPAAGQCAAHDVRYPPRASPRSPCSPPGRSVRRGT